jgi:DNA-binding MarR family transcriptional regulator
MLDRLQEADLVERRTDPADRRSWRLFLTGKAHELLGELRPLAEEMIDIAFEGIDDADRLRLMMTLDRMRLNLTRRPPEPMVSHG